MISRVSKHGGLWQTEEVMEQELSKFSESHQYNALVAQIKLRKNTMSKTCDPKMFFLSQKGKKFKIRKLLFFDRKL